MMDVPAMAGALMLAVAGACPAAEPPDIRVEARRRGTEIRHDLTRENLSEISPDTSLPYLIRNTRHALTGGVMTGDIELSYRVRFDDLPVPGQMHAGFTHEQCVRYREIDVTIELVPVVYVAREYEKGGCWYNEIIRHEHEHVEVDEDVIGTYADRIRDGLQMAFSEHRDSVSGPVPANPETTAVLKQNMGKLVVHMVESVTSTMTQDRMERQNDVDSSENYQKIINRCAEGSP